MPRIYFGGTNTLVPGEWHYSRHTSPWADSGTGNDGSWQKEPPDAIRIGQPMPLKADSFYETDHVVKEHVNITEIVGDCNTASAFIFCGYDGSGKTIRFGALETSVYISIGDGDRLDAGVYAYFNLSTFFGSIKIKRHHYHALKMISDKIRDSLLVKFYMDADPYNQYDYGGWKYLATLLWEPTRWTLNNGGIGGIYTQDFTHLGPPSLSGKSGWGVMGLLDGPGIDGSSAVMKVGS